jgi:signal transduction histidine kinase
VRRVFRINAFRLAATYFALFTASVVAFLAYFYFSTAGFIEQQTETAIHVEMRGLSEQYSQGGLKGLTDLIEARIAGHRIRETLYLLTDSRLRPIAGNLPAWPDGQRVRPEWIRFPVEVNDDGVTATVPALASTIVLNDGYRLLVGRDLRDAQAFRTRIDRMLGWAALLTLALGVVGGVSSMRNVLRSVAAVNRTTERIIHGDLGQRMLVTGSGDEFDQLSVNLNTMLDRIERLMMGMRQVTDNIAHDLRTPLARLRTRLEVILLEGPGARAADAVRDAIIEADRILSTFNALLKIAEAEAGSRRNAAGVVDLGEIARSMAELYEPLAEEKGIGLEVDSSGAPIKVRGDLHLLSQLVANLLDNALKYTLGGVVTMRAQGNGELARIEVADRGPGIPLEEREAVFDRFVRLEVSRSMPGNGLGLSLVRAVALLHDGKVWLEDAMPGCNPPGLKVVVTMPLAEEREPQYVPAAPAAKSVRPPPRGALDAPRRAPAVRRRGAAASRHSP